MAATKRKRTKKRDYLPVADGDLARLKVLLAKKQEYIAILELELTNTRADLNSFTEVYNQRVAPLQQRANHMRKILYDELERQRLDNPEKVPDYPGAGMHTNGRADDQPQMEENHRRDKDNGKPNQRNSNRDERPPDPKREAHIRDLFRKLAKRFHPDLTADPADKKRRQKIMTKVNQAYAARNLEALLKLTEQPDTAGANGSLSDAEDIARIKTELKRLDLVISELELTIRQIDVSPIMQLRLEVHMSRRDGRELLSDMTKELEVQINDLEEHLIVLGVEIEEQQD